MNSNTYWSSPFVVYARRTLLAFGVLALTAIACSMPSCCYGENIPSWHPEWYSNLFVGNLSVSGIVTDTQTHPLDAVNLRVTTVSGPDRGESDTASIRLLTNGQFALNLTNLHAVILDFEKNGYYSEMREYAVYGAELLPSGQVRTVSYPDISVILREKGELADLTTYQNFISFSDGGRAMVVDVSLDPRKAFFRVTNIDETNLPSTAIWLVATTNQAGEIVTNSNGVPQNVEMRVAIPGNGFVAFNPPSMDFPRVYSPLHDMTEAPATGYVTSFPLAPADEEYLFYFAVSNYFGKGSAVPVYVKDRTNIRTRVHLCVQRGGSRNVATDD